LKVLEFFASIVEPWIDPLAEKLSEIRLTAQQHNSITADGWMNKTSIHDAGSRKLAKILIWEKA
jgi:hypothetical protein